MKIFFRSVLFFSALLAHLALAQGHLDKWIYLEQKAIDRTVDETKIIAPDIQNQDAKFRPDSGLSFDLKSVWIPEDELNTAIDESSIPQELKGEFVRIGKNNKREFRLYIHPESEGFYKSLMDKYQATTEHVATSTASSRSVLVRSKKDPSKVYFVKLSLNVELGGVVRTIPAGEVARSIGTQRYLQARPEMRESFQTIPEVVGIIPKDWKRGGQIVRLIPQDVLNGKSQLVPMFSLYAKQEGSSVSLLETLAQKSGLDLPSFVKSKILDPFLKNWASWAVEHGVVMEAHAQNFLLELDNNGLPTGRFFHRDFGGFNTRLTPDDVVKYKLPVFTTLNEDYHQAFSDKAIVQSINTYFEGGFLFNIEKLLKEKVPAYKKGDITSYSRKQLAKNLEAYLGIEIPNATQSSFPSKLDAWVKKATLAKSNIQNVCSNKFEWLK